MVYRLGILVFLFILSLLLFPISLYASSDNGTISSTYKYAWSDQIGWVNFGPITGDVHVQDGMLTGYIWSTSLGWINLAPSQGGVTNNGEGVLSGSAWGEKLGWINFSGVQINESGRFRGKATGDLIGTLTFDCTLCNVQTDWRPRSVRTTTTPSPTSSPAPTRTPAPSATPRQNQISDTDQKFRSDIDDSSSIDILDFNTLLVNWGLSTGNPGVCSTSGVADINCDGVVDVLDFNIMMINWGAL